MIDTWFGGGKHPILGVTNIMSNTDHPEADRFLLERARCFFGSWRRLIEAMEGYKKWVRTNREFVHSIESLASVSMLECSFCVGFLGFECCNCEGLMVWMIWCMLQGFTWFLPERFSASEIGPEAGFVMTV